MIANFLKLLQRVLTLFIVIMLAYALLTSDITVLENLWISLAAVLWIPLTSWTTNRSRLDRITKRWKERNKNLGQNIVTPREKDE